MEILHKSENPSGDSLEGSEVGELSSRDDWFNRLSRSDSGQVADLGHGLREHSRLSWPLRKVKLAIQGPSTRGRSLSVEEGTVLLKHSLLDSKYLEHVSNSQEGVDQQ